MKKRPFGLKKKRKKRSSKWLHFLFDLLELAEFLILLPFRIIYYLLRAVLKAFGDLFNF